mmetsp:Transcript_34208/g.67350  ORF Transcript_34208/g.67350 Transcript_34208/m.67350 type:complete len:91 (+) Transcript_34208:346-618(+)
MLPSNNNSRHRESVRVPEREEQTFQRSQKSAVCTPMTVPAISLGPPTPVHSAINAPVSHALLLLRFSAPTAYAACLLDNLSCCCSVNACT